jgi:hypothetical protein
VEQPALFSDAMRVICSWCGRIMNEGDPAFPDAISHGICEKCLAQQLVMEEDYARLHHQGDCQD